MMVAEPLQWPGALRTSHLQQHLWQSGTRRCEVRALRLTGDVETGRLEAAIRTVAKGLPLLTAGLREEDGELSMVQERSVPLVVKSSALRLGDDRAVEILSRDRDAGADPQEGSLVRFHIVETAQQERVLGLVAHPCMLDLHSIYLVLGAVMLAYVGRFRTDQYPPLADVIDCVPVTDATVLRSHARWWSRRLADWSGRVPSAEPTGAPPLRREFFIDHERWRCMNALGGTGGNTGSLAVMGLLARWVRERQGGSALFGSTLDLRDYLGLGSVIGPLTDRILFEVNLDGLGSDLSEAIPRCHAALLDSVIHHLPYRDIDRMGVAGSRPISVNYCRTPPASSFTRDEETLGHQGLSIELFCESRLVGGAPLDEGGMEVHIAESGPDMAVVIDVDPGVFSPVDVDGLLRDIGQALDELNTDSDTTVGVGHPASEEEGR